MFVQEHSGLENSSLVILAHGSSTNENSAQSAVAHADAIRSLGLFKEVQPAFWKQAPGIKDVLTGAASARVFIVPLFMSAGFFAEETIPAALGFPSGSRTLQLPEKLIFYCAPVGMDPDITGI